jgi:hypothetical protein
MSNFDEQLEEELKKRKKKLSERYIGSSLSSKDLTSGRYSYLPGSQVAPTPGPIPEWKSNAKKTIATNVDKDDDIAPVKERKWFDKGAFEDGYQFGDILRTVEGTSKDIIENLQTGVFGIAESAVDAGAYIAGGVGKLFGADKFADRTQKFIEKNLIDEEKIAKKIVSGSPALISLTRGEDTDDVSVLGEKTDSLVQSGGQLLGTIGLQSVGVPWYLTSGVTSFGGEAENAFKEGASYGEAGLSAAVSAGAEILTEKLFGGSGLGEKGVINLDGLTRGISNKLVKVLADHGVDMLAEGAEEVVSQVASNLGSALYREENLKDILLSEEALDGYLESFIGGFALGGVANVGKANNSFKTGRDYRTNLTENETKVFNKVYEDEIAKREKNGKKLTKNEKAEIYDDVLKQMERGYIDTDTIESVLGDRSAYDAISKEADEFNTLYNTEGGKLSEAQRDRLAELKAKNEANPYKKAVEDAKNAFSKSVYGSLTRQVGKNVQTDNYLLESYNEKARAGEDFKADFEKFKGAKHFDAAQKTIENAMKAGANNTNRVHDIVDFAAKIAGDTGKAFDFQSDEMIKADFIKRQTAKIAKLEAIPEAERTAEQKKMLADFKDQLAKVKSGKATVNGNITANGIVLNLSSAKPLNRIVGHEVTHIFEPEKGKKASQEYTNLEKALYSYAKSKGVDIDKKLAEYKMLYEGIDGADAKSEMIADMVGDYLFDDTDFAYHLSVQDQNVFQRVWNEIKHLYNLATAGSKEARELERVKKAFEEAYRKSSHGKEFGDSDVKYSIRKEAPPKETGVAYKVFFVKDGKLYPPMVANPDGADTPMGVWLNADMGVAAPPSKTGRAQVKAGGKGTQGGGGSLAFRPGWHLGDLPRASQFDRVNPETGKKELFPENFVWAEVEYAKDVDYQEEAMSYGYTENGKFRHAYAGLPRLPENGYYRYRTNPNPDTVPWVITGAMKVNRLLSDAEVNKILAENGVDPVHRQGGDVGLDKFGFNEDGTVKYSLSDQTDMRFTPAEIQTIQSIGRKSINSFNSQDIAATEKFARRYWQEIGTKSPFYRAWFGDWRVKDTTPIQVATQRGDTRTEHTNKDTGWSIRNSRVVHNETTSHKSLMNREAVPYLPYIDEIIANAVLLDTEGVGKPKSENSLLMHYLYAVADVGNGPEVLKLTVEEMYNPGTKGTNKRAYTLQNIEKAFTASGRVQGNSPSSGTNTANAVRTVADLFSLVKSYDKNFAPNASSKIVNADGTPKVMYHGSPAQFTVFDKNKAKSSGHYGKGFYFTDSTSHAGTYGNQYNVYLNIRNPLQSSGDMVSRSQVRKFLEAVAENEDYSIENYGTYDVDAVLNNVMGQDKAADAFRIIQDINATAIGDMVEATELFNSVNGTEFDGIVVPTETVAFYPEQIKSATDNIGTFDKSNPDIRYSLSDTEGRQLSNEQAEYFKDSVVRDENGNLKVMYHGTSKGGFTVFDTYGSNYGLFGTGSYFTDSQTVAESYTTKGKGKNPQVYEAYLNITNPMDMDAQADPEEWADAFEDVYFPESGTNEDFYRAVEEYYEDQWMSKYEAAEEIQATLESGMGYDGITHIGGGRVDPNGERHRVYIAFQPEQIKNTDNVKPTTDADIRYSLSERTYAEIQEEQQSLYQREQEVKERKRQAENNPELLQAMDDYSNLFTEMRLLLPKRRDGTATQADLDRIEEIKALRDEYLKRVADIQKNIGLNALTKEADEIRKRKEELRVASDVAWAREGAEKENKAIVKAGVPAQEYFRKKALKAFKTTTNFNEAGYLLPDGKLLNFSGGERNHRHRDHREIGEIYEATNGVDALNRFMRDGNIRIMAESPGADLPSGVEPTAEQYIALRKFINSHGTAEGQFFVDFSGEDGHRVGNYSYQGRVNADRVINDIKYFYQTGEVREQSSIGQFLSLSNGNEGFTPYRANELYGDHFLKEIAPVNTEVKTEVNTEVKNATETEETASPQSEERKSTRKDLHNGIVDNIKSMFAARGLDFDTVLKKAKNLSTFSTVDNTPQRVMEKSLGYKEGQVLADATVNKVAQNETEKIKWLNSFTDRKNGELAQLAKKHNIKPGSKESAAAQMYAEGFYVDDNNNIIQYGDRELAIDFPDVTVQRNIKALARDPRIRQIYDETLKAINESRARNLYPEIPRLDNYFLHFRAQTDTFSRLGLPFNPNDIRAKDLPTDLNGVTADLKPGQPYFASAMHRKGKRTSFDLLGGLEKYLTSAANQIYHIDDIQTLRALRNYIAETYGQASGLEDLDSLSDEEAELRIQQVYDSHLSTFAKFLNEEANVLAGKTALIDRGLEGIIGRRGMTFLDTVNRQVGANMVGFNVSSSLTNFLSVAQGFAKTNKADFVKAFGQTVSNKVGSIFGRNDGFAENSPVMIRRNGADRFYRTPFQKAADTGYVLMSAVDGISTELIARTKYNELIKKGMDSKQAHIETDKWVSRLMGDRSLGQQPQLYNSKMLGLITKFQLEVRNQLDSQFYDTIQEAKVSNEDIENALLRNATTAAKVTSTFVQLAVVQHLFGKAFESVAGYNPAFDIISVLLTALGFDDEEDSEDTALDNIEQGFLELMGDLPYTSTMTGGRIPISSALPIKEFITGTDQYGNEKSRLETIGEVAPYYLLPGGYGQIKKTIQGLGMFSEDHPIAGSYTNSGKLRFPVEDTFGNRLKAGIFGQYASANARDYFDNERSSLTQKQILEFMEVDMTIQEYWNYREGLKGKDTLGEKVAYINSLDLPIHTKNILVNNLSDREEPIDMTDYGEYDDWGEFEYAHKYPEKHSFLEANGVSYDEYKNFDDDTKEAWNWAYQNQEKFTVSKAISDDFMTYYKYKSDLGKLKADKDADGDSIPGSKKEKVIEYINNLDIDYGQKIILLRSMYDSKEDRANYNADIVDYLNSREDISYEDMVAILKELGFAVSSDGTVTWD